MDLERIKKYKDDQQAKKDEAARKAAIEARANQLKDTVSASGKEVAKSVANSNKDLAKSDDVQGVVDSINKLNVTTFLASKDSWSQIVGDMASAAERIQKVMKNLDGGASKIDSSLSAAVNTLQAAVDKLKSIQLASDKDILTELKKQNGLLENLDINPVVNVASPNVKVDAPSVDLSGVEKAISSIKPVQVAPGLKLEDYRAQDMDDNETYQYVGFVNPTGAWYIIENDIDGNSIRYVFGTKNYPSNWRSHVSLAYKLLNEAYRAKV
jgi:hypothetical protein